MSYNVTLNKKLPEQGVYNQILNGHIVDRKHIKLYPRAGAGSYSPGSYSRLEFRLPSHGHIDCLKSHMSYTLRITASQEGVRLPTSLRLPQDAVTDPVAVYNDYVANRRSIKIDSLTTRGLASREAVEIDTAAYMLGGFNGSTASPFSRFRLLMNNEQVEDIEEYHGLAAYLNSNIPDTYRRSAAGHIQFLAPRGSREMILNALIRGSSVLTASNSDALGGLNAFYASNAVRKSVGVNTVTEYTQLMHLPVSGILSNSKLLPAKFLPAVDLEFTLAPVSQVLQVASGFACNRFVSTYCGAFFRGFPNLTYTGLNAQTTSASSINQLEAILRSDADVAKYLASYISILTAQGIQRSDLISDDEKAGHCLSSKYLNNIKYEIVDPIYHLEVVYMSEDYDAAFANALTRGVTYAFDTYAYCSNTVNSDGVVGIPVTKTSVKSIHSGFCNSSARQGLLANYWHFVDPHLESYQFKFGGKLVPQEPVYVHNDKGMRSLMLYLKSVHAHYDTNVGFNYNWVNSDFSFASLNTPYSTNMVDSGVQSNVLGAGSAGPNTWCYASGKGPRPFDLTEAFGEYPVSRNLSLVSASTDFAMIGVTANNDPINDFSPIKTRLHDSFSSEDRLNFLRCLYAYNVGTFVLGLDLEAEQGALSGINPSGSTMMPEWDFKFKSAPEAQMNLHTWVRYDKALRFEPFGNVSILID